MEGDRLGPIGQPSRRFTVRLAKFGKLRVTAADNGFE
jgi:hypothetical protein